MLRTQRGYFADRVSYPSERHLVEARLRMLRRVVLGLRHDWRAYAVAAAACLFAFLADVVLLPPSHLFWGAALGGSIAFFATRALDIRAAYLEAREEFGNLTMRRIALIMDTTDEAAARIIRERRAKEVVP